MGIVRITVSELIANPVFYFELDADNEVEVTHDGKCVCSIAGRKEEPIPVEQKLAALDSIYKIMANAPKDLDVDAIRLERLSR
jgi:hypothetical protein